MPRPEGARECDIGLPRGIPCPVEKQRQPPSCCTKQPRVSNNIADTSTRAAHRFTRKIPEHRHRNGQHRRRGEIATHHPSPRSQRIETLLNALRNPFQHRHIGVGWSGYRNRHRRRARAHRGNIREICGRGLPPQFPRSVPCEPKVWPVHHRVGRDNKPTTRRCDNGTIITRADKRCDCRPQPRQDSGKHSILPERTERVRSGRQRPRNIPGIGKNHTITLA